MSNALFLAPNFVFFTHATWHVDLSWNNFMGMENVKMYVQIFGFNFFNILNISNMYFKTKGAYAPRSQNTILFHFSCIYFAKV
jgi:hypothetical protein